MVYRLVVDGIEGDIVRLEDEHCATTVHLPLSMMPPGLATGDVITVTIAHDREYEANERERARILMNQVL